MAALTLTGVTKHLGGRTIIPGLDLKVAAGELVCLLGPSGCGKTTTLRMIGGFLRPDAGQIMIGDRDVTAEPPERRPTAMVFQNYALWPHMSVFRNVAFGLKVRKLPKPEIAERVERALEMVNLTHHLHSSPAAISGGEQQRVALARALVLEPEVLLLDEPLSNLDAKLRVRVRDDIRDIQRRLGITTVVVTHDQDEALSISDRIAVMSGGVVEQYGTGTDLYARPETAFVAEFLGTMNTFDGVPAGVEIRVGELAVPCSDLDDTGVGPAEIRVRPEDVRLSPDGPGPVGRIVRELPRGHYQEVVVEVGPLRLRVFTATGFTLDEPRVSFARALVYREGRLASPATSRG
jgi:putative spermidine/putrescine transport system ATP-binding protein